MSHGRYLRGRFRLRRGARRWAVLVLLMVSLSGLLIFLSVTSSSQLAAKAATLLEAMTGTRAQIDSARFGFDGGIVLRGIRLTVPGLDPQHSQFFEAEQVLIRHSFLSLIQGQFVARRLTLVNPRVYLTLDTSSGTVNYEHLLETGGEDTGPPKPIKMPEIFMRGGQIKIGQIRR